MTEKSRGRERLRAYGKTFLRNWALFRESKIGVVGLGIMIAFVVLALLAPVLATRDPLAYRAPDEDRIVAQTFWEVSLAGPISTPVATRVFPAATDPTVDRLYIAAGSRLYAVRAENGKAIWLGEGSVDPGSTITAGPLSVNLGSSVDGRDAIWRIIIGTEDGRVLVYEDGKDRLQTGADPPPRDPNGRAQLPSAVTALAVWSTGAVGSGAEGFEPEERIYAGTDDGWIYAFNASSFGTGVVKNLVASEAWRFRGTGQVRMASLPMGPKTYPRFSPALSEDSSVLAANVGGNWTALDTSTGTELWSWCPASTCPSTTWTTPPIVSESGPLVKQFLDGAPDPIDLGQGELTYIATDDGWVFARYPQNGTEYIVLQYLGLIHEPTLAHGFHIDDTRAGASGGVSLTTPSLLGTDVFLGTSTGEVLAIRMHPTGELPAGSEIWRYRDPRASGNEHVEFPIVQYSGQGLVMTTQRDDRGTADPTDDQGILFALDSARGTKTWSVVLTTPIAGTPAIWRDDPVRGHTTESVWVGTADGQLHSLKAPGEVITPLPPGCYPSTNCYLLGTDAQGRDIYSQLLWGSRIALFVGFAAASFSIAIGLIVGLVAGYSGGKVDTLLMRFTDLILVLPGLPLLIVFAAVLGAGIMNLVLIISLLGWASVARVIRSQILSLKERPYVEAARVTGASHLRIMFRHLAPNVLPIAFLYMTFAVSGAIISEASLSFLGLGDVNTPSWGLMLSTAQTSNMLAAPWWLLPPGLAITLLSLAFFLVGRAFEQIVNPRLRRR